MKVLVTILQCRRVVSPYLFITHALPMMEKALGSAIEVHLIQHRAGDIKSRMVTSSYPSEKEELVAEWTKAGKYGNATITQHSQTNPIYPSLPSWQIGFDYALKSNADLFLWLEDDAFVYDPNCGTWPELLRHADVGFYRLHRDEPFKYIRNAHYVCTRAFVEKFLPVVKEDSLWDIRQPIYLDMEKGILNKDAPRMEPMLTKYAGERIVELGTGCAARFSISPEGRDAFLNLIKEKCPGESSLLQIDFPNSEHYVQRAEGK